MKEIKGLRVKTYSTPLFIWRYRIIHVKKFPFVCSKTCTSKLEQSTGDQTTAEISVNTAFFKSSQRKKVILTPGLEKFLAKEETILNAQITKHLSTAYGNYSATILLLQQRCCMALSKPWLFSKAIILNILLLGTAWSWQLRN